jgi:hypothetical protein
MSILIFITLLLLSLTALVLSKLHRKPAPKSFSNISEPRRFDGLFAAEHAREARLHAQAEAKLRAEEELQRLFERADAGDQSSLDEAYESGDRAIYDEVMRKLIVQAEGRTEALRSIAEYLINSGRLRSSNDFARTMFEIWGESFDRGSMTNLLYLSALSNDGAVFLHAVQISYEKWRAGALPQVSAQDFLATVESAYWLIAIEVRYSGSGFLIKQAIAHIRRELAAMNRRFTYE